MILDTTGIAPGTYLLYTTNLNYLSNDGEDFGGMMTEITISAKVWSDNHVLQESGNAHSDRDSWPSSACAPRAPASAEIPGVSGTSFTLTAKADRITTPDGGSIYFWGFASGGGRPQYPGADADIPQGRRVTITVVNQLPAQFNQRVSLAVAGLSGVVATCAGAPRRASRGRSRWRRRRAAR